MEVVQGFLGAEPDALEALGVGHVCHLALILGVDLDEAINVSAGARDLTCVLLQCVYLVVNGVGDVYEGVGVLGAPHENVANLVCLQAFLNMLVVVQEVASVGEDGVERDLPGYPVVSVR